MSIPGVKDVAVVIDKHTGRVRATFQGLGAGADARSHLRTCQLGGSSGVKVDHLNSACVVTGEQAKKAIRDGRL